MPELLLMRHAKSDWSAGTSADADRPLAVKRFVEAHRGGERFHDECELLAPVVAGARSINTLPVRRPLRPLVSGRRPVRRR